MSVSITRVEINNSMVEKEGLSLVKFKTEWSGACQILEPVFNKLALTYKGLVNFFTIDVEVEKGVQEEYGIIELPTILFFSKGIIIDHTIGLISKNGLINKIENALAKMDDK